MNDPRSRSLFVRVSTTLLATFLALTFVASHVARAGAVVEVTSGTASDEFAVFGLGAKSTASAPVFRNDGVMLFSGGAANNGYFTLLSETGGTFKPTNLSITPDASRVVVDATTPAILSAIGNGTNFGSATLETLADVGRIGSQGNNVNGTGVFYTSSSFARSSLADGVASVAVSTADAFFTYTGGAVSGTPGALLSVNATLGTSPGSFVAAGLTSVLIVSRAGIANVTYQLGDIAMAYQGLGTGIGGLTGVAGFPRRATGTRSVVLNNPITLLPGDLFEIRSTLTLISDPDSIISISSTLANGFSGPVPTFGAFGVDPRAVPEPSAWVLVGSGLVAAGIARRNGKGRRRNPSA